MIRGNYLDKTINLGFRTEEVFKDFVLYAKSGISIKLIYNCKETIKECHNAFNFFS